MVLKNYKLVAKTANFIYKFIKVQLVSQQLAIRQNIEMLEPNYHIQNWLNLFRWNHYYMKVFYFRWKQNYNLPVLYQIIWCLDFIFYSLKRQRCCRCFLTKIGYWWITKFNITYFHLRNRLLNSKTDRNKRLLHNEVVKLTVLLGINSERW
jgi:hypothetical protein